jgi:hypothetical protein
MKEKKEKRERKAEGCFLPGMIPVLFLSVGIRVIRG